MRATSSIIDWTPARSGAAATDTADADVRLSTWLSPAHMLISVILVISVLLGLFWIASRQDSMARVNARQMVVSKIESIERRQREITADNSIWTEAFEAYSNGDISWLYDNVGTAAMIGTVDLVVFLPADGKTQIGWIGDTPPEGADGLLPAEVANAMLALLAGSKPEEMPVESAYTWFDGDYWLMTISRVVHTDGVPVGVPDADMPRQIRGVRANSLALEVAEQFGLEGVRLTDGARAITPDDDSVPLELIGTDQHTGLVWKPPTPGTAILKQVVAPVTVFISIFLVAAVLLSRLASRSAHRLETALVDARAADRAKTDFLGIVSHELRTPMNGIIGLGQVLQQQDLGERQRALVDTMMKSATSEMRMIETLLDLTQIQSGKLRLNELPFSISSVVTEVVNMARLEAASKGLSIALVEDVAADRLIGDAQAVRQIVTNLVDNAIKFTDEGGVTVRVSSTPVADRSRRGLAMADLRIDVCDTGIGIADDDQERIFLHLTQLDESSTRSASGLGIGLAICRSLTKMMGGAIRVESTPGEGSIFRLVVTMPLVESLDQAAA